MSKKKTLWWYIKEGSLFLLNTTIAFLPDILALSPEYTVAGKVAGLLSQAWRVAQIRKMYMENTLPSLMIRLLDRAPNKITGERKQDLPDGLSKYEDWRQINEDTDK